MDEREQSTWSAESHPGAAEVSERIRSVLSEAESAANALRHQVAGLRALTVYASRQAQVITDVETARVDVVGADQDYITVRGYVLRSGRDLTALDVSTKARVVLMGSTAARRSFGDTDPVGRTLRVGQSRFEVIGVLESKGHGIGEHFFECFGWHAPEPVFIDAMDEFLEAK